MTKRKNPAAVALAKLRIKKLSPERRQEIAGLGGKAAMAKMTAKQRSQFAAMGGSVGGRVGGKARAESLSARKRSEIARRAAAARWKRADG